VSARNCVGRVLPSGPANLTMHSTRAILYKVFYSNPIKLFFFLIDSTM
jgi:hypothetical protein